MRTWADNTQNLAFRLNNGVPNQLTEYISPWVNNALGAWHAVFVQDQYTAGRLTLQGALRFDHSSSWYPEQTEGPSKFFPTAVVIPETKGVTVRNGWTFQGGTSTGQGAGDNCEVRGNLPELTGNLIQGLPGINTSPVNTTNPYCKVDYGWLTQFRALSNYVIPKIDVQFSGVFQSKPGALLAANWAVPSATIAQSLGRNPAGNPANVTINILAPGEMYGDRVNQLDFRAGKVLRFGRTRTLISADLYNALNSSTVLTYNNAFVPSGTWLQPQTVLTGRLIKFAAEITF